jgi:hypothetical protein
MPPLRPRAHIYVDGFNLYYQRLRRTPFKWLNVEELARKLFPNLDVALVKYFTARVKPSVFDPGMEQRQDVYLTALRTCSRTQVIEGSYQSHPKRLPLAADFRAGRMNPVEVIVSEKKGSDVNLASHLLLDACQGSFDVAAVIINDSDLTTPIEMVTKMLSKQVVLVSPLKPSSTRRRNRSLVKAASSQKAIRDGVLRSSLLPDPVPHPRLRIRKPRRW